jgi:hypothetical protein
MDDKMKQYILFILNNCLRKPYVNFGHDWGQQFKHDAIYTALSLLVKYFKGDEKQKEDIIQWFQKSNFKSPKFGHSFAFGENLYLLINLHFVINKTIKSKD